VNQNDLGSFFVDANGRVFQMVSFTAQPTARFHQIGGPHELSGVVGAPILADLKPTTADQVGQEMKRLLGKLDQPFQMPGALTPQGDPS
jgi:hypothetical protein